MEITPQTEAAARALAQKIECDESRWFQYAHAAELALAAAAAATETSIVLDSTEYEASILTSALDQFRSQFVNPDGSDSADSGTAEDLRERILAQLPAAWTQS